MKHFAMAGISKGSSLTSKSREIMLGEEKKSEAIPPMPLKDAETSHQTDAVFSADIWRRVL